MTTETVTERLRRHIKTLRTNSVRLADLIPLLAEAADTLDSVQCEASLKSVESYTRGHDAGWAAAMDYVKHKPVPIQGGLSNVDIALHWNSKLPGVQATDEELRAFALGIEVGMVRERMGKVQPADPDIEARIDAKLGIELLPPIRVSKTTADLIKRFGELEGIIPQAVVRQVLEERFSAGGSNGN